MACAPGLGAEEDEESKYEFVAADETEDSDASLTDDESLASALTLLRPPSGGAAPADAPAVPQEHVAAAMAPARAEDDTGARAVPEVRACVDQA
jgi:hypothetical protein